MHCVIIILLSVLHTILIIFYFSDEYQVQRGIKVGDFIVFYKDEQTGRYVCAQPQNYTLSLKDCN